MERLKLEPARTTLGKARTDFADLLDKLSDDQLASPSLCSEWTVIDVAGHLVSLVELSKLQLVAGVAKNKGDSDRFLGAVAKDFSVRGAAAMSASLRTNADKQLKPFSEESMVADTAVHTLDVQRPLGLDPVLDKTVLRVALDYSVGEFAKKFKNSVAPRLVANDIDWSAGSGPEITGTAEALLLATNGRDVFEELEGAGTDLLR